jgi:hypothetical protein
MGEKRVMPLNEAVEIKNQGPIVDRLEAAKQAGVISDYLLRWRGDATGFMPKVTVWSTAAIATEFVRDQLIGILGDLVGATQIIVLED